MFRKLVLGAVAAVTAVSGLMVAITLSPTTAVGAGSNCDTTAGGQDASEQAVFDQINAYRAQNGLAPLKVSPTLSRAAAWMVSDMVQNAYFDHYDHLGRSPFQRVVDCGYGSSGAGEILAVAGSGATAVQLWKGSSGHNAIMLGANWKVMGVGHAGNYWAVDFGSLDDSGQTVPPPQPTQPPQSAAPSSQPSASPTAPLPTSTPAAPKLPVKRAVVPLITTD